MTPYQGFVEMIRRRTTLTGLLMTPDAAFGHERRGTPESLAVLGRELGFQVIVVPPFRIAGREVRSADIRGLIVLGELAGAADLLGRPYAFVGERAVSRQATLAEGRHEVLTFSLPVALPPPGHHRGYVEAAWRPGRAIGGRGSDAGPARERPDAMPAASESAAGVASPAEIVIPAEPGWVEIRSDVPLPDAPRLRVTLAS